MISVLKSVARELEARSSANAPEFAAPPKGGALHFATHKPILFPLPDACARGPSFSNFQLGRTRVTTSMEKVPMTVEGYHALDEDLKRLKTIERPAVTAAIGEARLHGDLSENAEYHAAKDRQGWIEGQIAEIEDKMARAQVIDVRKLSGNQVKFGATVSVIDEDTEEKARYQIVGEHEADVKKGRVSITSPIARAMIGKESGEVVEVNTPGGVKAYEIVKVEWV